MVKQRRMGVLIFALIMVVVTLYTIFNGEGSINVQVNDEAVGVSGPNKSTQFVMLEDIVSAQLLDSWEKGKCISGIDSEKYSEGLYCTVDGEEYLLCVENKLETYIYIQTREKIYVFNCTSSNYTKQLFEDIENRRDDK